MATVTYRSSFNVHVPLPVDTNTYASGDTITVAPVITQNVTLQSGTYICFAWDAEGGGGTYAGGSSYICDGEDVIFNASWQSAEDVAYIILTYIDTYSGGSYISPNQAYDKCLSVYLEYLKYDVTKFGYVWNCLSDMIPSVKEAQKTQYNVASSSVIEIWTGTLAEFNAMSYHKNNVLYFIITST